MPRRAGVRGGEFPRRMSLGVSVEVNLFLLGQESKSGSTLERWQVRESDETQRGRDRQRDWRMGPGLFEGGTGNPISGRFGGSSRERRRANALKIGRLTGGNTGPESCVLSGINIYGHPTTIQRKS